jgi:signal peptidase I
LKKKGLSSSAYVVGFVLFLVVFGYLEFTYTRRVESTSMLPTLEEGDQVVLLNVPFSSLKLGDIIVYNPPCSQNGGSVIHRIVAFADGGVITKGDNNQYTDPAGAISAGPVTSNCYEGKVVFVIPYIERIASLPYGANYILAALILIAVVYAELRPRGGKGQPAEEGPSG